MTEFEKARSQSLDHLSNVILQQFLVPPSSMPLHELLIFDDLSSIRRKIVGEDRAAQYTAFVNPQHYIKVKKNHDLFIYFMYTKLNFYYVYSVIAVN